MRGQKIKVPNLRILNEKTAEEQIRGYERKIQRTT